MDLNSSARSPLSLSKSFYDDITKDIPSPVSKDFYDAVSKPVEAKQVPVTPARYEMASPGEIAETVGAIGEAVIRIPLQVAGATASAIRGGSREAIADKNSFLTRIIDTANKDAEDFQKKYADNKVVIAPLTKLGLPADLDTQTITRAPQQAAFSAVSAGAGLAAGLGTAAISGPAAPIAGRAAGMAASGAAGYRIQKDMSAQQLYAKLNETSMKAVGRELTPEEWKTAYDRNEGLLVEQGISEAIPEAIGNLVGFELFFGAAKNIFGKQLAKTVIGKTLGKYGAGAVGKLLAEQATEQATETVSQQWQHNLDLEMGLSPGATKRSWTSFDDLRQSNKEIFSDILLLTAGMGGAGLVGGHIQAKMDTKASAQLVKNVVAENKFGSIPNEFLPAMYEHAQELSDKRPQDKGLTTARDAFATEMDKRGIDFDMTSKFKEYLALDAEIKTEDATGEDVARWVSLRDEFNEKNISPDLYQQYLTYQSDINKAVGLQKLIATGKATDPQRKEFNRLAGAVASKATMFGFPEEVLDSTGVEKGGVVRKPLGPAKGAARDILLADEPAAKRKNLTAKDILTEGDVDIQSEDDLTPEALADIDKKLKIAGTGGARTPLNVAGETPAKVLDITKEVKTQDKKTFDLWDTQETGTPPFVRTKVESLFAEGGTAAVLDEYRGEDTVSAYARYRLGMLEKTAVDKKTAEAPAAQGAAQETGLANQIATGNLVEDFTFPEHYSPMDLNGLWDELYMASDDIAAKNKPTIDALAQERDALKSDRGKEAVARKKQIDEEIGNLRAESQIVTRHAEIAWQYAQEDLARKVVAKLKAEGIEADNDTVYDAIATLADGRMNEQGWKQPLLQQVIDSVKGGEAPTPKSAREKSDEEVKQYRDAGHNINDNGVYNEPEKISIPFSKSSGREGSIRIAEGPDGKFRIGVNISKKYGDYEGSGNAPGIDGTPYDTRAEAIKAGIDIIRSRTKDDDSKGKAALVELAKFEKEQATETKAAGTGGARGPVDAVESAPRKIVTVIRTEHVDRSKASAADLAADYKARGLDRHLAWDEFIKDRILKPEIDAKVFYALFDKTSPIPLVGKRTSEEVSFVPTHRRISSGELVQAEPPNESGIAKVITESGKAESDHISNLASLGKKAPEKIGRQTKEPWQMTRGEFRNQPNVFSDAQAYAQHYTEVKQALSEGKPVPTEVLKDYPELEKTEEPTEIKAAGTGGARGPKAGTVKAPEAAKTEKPVPTAAELKSKEEEGKSRGVKKYLLEHLDEAIAARTAYENNKTEDAGPLHVLIDVPMDGKFRILNTKENLEKFKRKVSGMKVTAALNKLPQHSDKPTGKSTDLITKEAEAEVSDYWTKRSEWKARYEAIPTEVEAAKARLDRYNEIKRKVDAKEITLKQLGEDAKAASNEENAGPEAWRDSWFGKTPTYKDLTDRIKEIEKEISDLEASRPEIETTIKSYYPGLAKEMFEGKAVGKAGEEKAPAGATAEVKEPWQMTKEEYRNGDVKLVAAQKDLDAANAGLGTGKWEHAGVRLKRVEAAKKRWSKAWDGADKTHGEAVRQALAEGKPVPESVLKDYPEFQKAPEEIKAAGTGGKRGPKEEKESAASGNEQAEIRDRLRAQNAREAEFEYQKRRIALLEDADKVSQAEKFSQEDAKRFLSDLDASPGDDPAAREALYAKYPEIAPPKGEAQPVAAEKKEAPYAAAVGKIAGKADRAKERGYEFAYGETAKGSELYWDMVGIFSGASADKLVEAGIIIRKIQAEAPQADILKEIAEISDEDLDALLDVPEKKEAAPIIFQIDDMVRPKAGSGISEKNAGRVLHIFTAADGVQSIRTEGSGKIHFFAKHFELASKEATPSDEAVKRRSEQLTELSKDLTPFSKTMPAKPTPSEMGVRKESPTMRQATLMGRTVWTNGSYIENSELDPYPKMQGRTLETGGLANGNIIWNQAKDYDVIVEGPLALLTRDRETIEKEIYLFDLGADHPLFVAKRLYDHFYMRYGNLILKWSGDSKDKLPMLSVYDGDEMVGAMMPIADNSIESVKAIKEALALKKGKHPLLEGRGSILPSAKPAKALDDILADVAKEGVEGAGEALKGLYELFGGASLKSFPGGFDEDTYLKAKPHFEAALDHFIKVGKGLREFAASIVQQFGDAIRPYLKQFIKDRRDGVTEENAEEEGEVINLDENTGNGEGGARTRRKLTDQEKAEKKAKEVAAEEKKARKAAMGEFKNVGYVYDPEKLNQKIKDKPPKSAAKIILDEMVPGKLWAIDFPEGATPGVVRVKDQIQKHFLTFKEYLTENRDRLRYMSGKTIDDKIEHWLNFREGSIDKLKEWANEYGKTMQPVIDAFNGQASIINVIGRLQDTVLVGARQEDGRFPPYTEVQHSFVGLMSTRDYVQRPHSLYAFLTDSWQRLLEDENDILLSEIDINKRGRNKMVVRSGLPDYREDVELKKTEDFQAPFGFKGVGFGEEGWINQEERNRVIPAAYDAFKDLAATIGAPDNGMSLGGELAVQFANLGHKAKGAAAAYFPTVQTINFTRDNGDGTMAHEWGHGLQDLAADDAKTEIEKVVNTFHHVYDFEAGTRLVDDLLAKDSMFLKRMVSSKKQQRIEAVKNEVTSRFEDTVRKDTDYYSTAQQMDPDYTARAQEMWARAFEAYIYDTLQGKNNYLVNDFVAAGRVGGKAGVGTRLVYPSGKERETFNATIKHLLDGLVWDESGKPSLKGDYVSIEKANELMLQLQLRYLLEQVEARYTAIWASEPSKDGYFWYRYDDTSFGPMMQPDGYDGYDKVHTSEGQNGTGAVAYLTQLHPDAILDYKLSNIQYEGENPTYISKERGGIDVTLQDDGTEALEEVPPKPDGSPDEEGDVRSGDRGSGDSGVPGTFEHGKQRGTTGSSEGDSAEGVHPSPAGNYRITDLTLNDPKSVPVRFGLNLSAVKVLNLVESENRIPTDAEKDIMAQYSGWGGMSELFAYEPTAAWAGKAELLKAELTENEIRDAASSSTSSYYTPVVVGQFMWKLAQRLGFEKGVVLDPAVGANGLFLGTIPADLSQGTALQGIEMDTLSARIASKLYGLASIENKAFQDVKKPNNRFDLTITNVPFERITPTDLKHNKGGHTLHNYFINKMLNLTAPGALSMMITTSNTLDTVGAHLTEYAEKAHFVGAIRLPSGIYSATKVATDILVFRKKIEGGKFTGIPTEEWTTAGEDESTGLTINNYFLKHPEMVAGKLEKITGRYGNEGLRVVGDGDLQANLERIAAAFPDKIVEREAVREAKSIDDIISAPGTIKEGGLYINDKDEVCLKEDGEEMKLPVATASEQKKAAIARGYVHILDQVRTVLRAQKTETDDAVVKAEQTKLKKFYDQFVKKFGPINDPKNHDVYVDYTDSAWVIALEEYDPDTGKVTKIADIFTKNITGIASRPDRADTDHDALAMALDEFGYPNLEYMARLRNSDVASVMAGVGDKIIENPETGFLETMDEYLSGNVKRKLAVASEMAQSNPEYARNVSLLEAAQPAEIPQHRITARIGASWISPEHLAEFVRDKMGLRHGLHAVFNFSPVSNEWSMSFHGEEHYRGRGKGVSENKAEVQRQIAAAKGSVEATTLWGTQRMDFFELMKCALQGKRPQVTVYVEGKQYLDEVATQAAEVKLQDIQLEFGRWLFADTFRSDQAVKRFNDLINTSVPMNADGSHLTFPGKSMWMVTPKEKATLGVGDALVFYPHQMNAAWKYLKNGNLYLGHEVGTGKTVTMGLIAMEAKRLRGKKKVLYVTLNDSTMGQAVAEIKNLYPMANILPVRVSTNEQRKQRSLQKIALNDFDIAIMRQQDYDRIGLSPESERVFIEEEILELREILEEAKRDGARILEQDIQVQLHALEEKLKAPSVYDEAKKKNLFFDDLGIDLLIVDEAHKYKNVPYATRLTRITGLNPAGSPTAKDFFRKTQYLNAQFPKKDGIVLASGTALSNSIAELYNIQRMLQPLEVKRQGVWSFDRWIANHGDMGSQLEWDGARGQYKVITTNRRIVNAGRLLATAYQNIDSVRADDTPVKRPIIRGGEPQRVKVAPNQYVEDYKRIILERCAGIEADPKNAEYEGVPDNMLRIISNMSKVAIDQRLDHHYANTEMQQDSKIATASKIMYRRWKEEAAHKGVQLVFADLGIPGKYADKFKYKTEDEISKLNPEDLTLYNEEMFEHESASAGFDTYEGLKKELVKLGIPENQVAFIHDADHTNKEKKAANLRTLFKKINAGDIRVLIGSTSKAGTGVNIQGRVSDIHHLDVWWNFSAWEQRNGRGIRAGNLYANEGMPGTYIWNYVTETTVDATRWDKVFAKGKVLNAVLGGDINLDVIEDISDETMSAKMMAAEASGDPLMSTQATLLQKVQGLRFEQAAHLDVVRRSRMDLAAIPGRIEAMEKSIVDYQHSRGIMSKVTAVRFMGDDRTLVLEKHGKEIAEALEKAVMADTGSWTENKKATLLVFGSHTETEVVETVEGKDGEQKEKKTKKYAFVPLPAKADITGKSADPYGRRLLMSGDIISSDRNLADIKASLGKKGIEATVDIKANVSRTVTEFLSWLNSSEKSAKERIEELKDNTPKLRKVIDTPWVKVDELATNDKELREVEAKMAARGIAAGDPIAGIPIDKYKGVIPVLEDVADKDGWSFHDGIVYPHQNTTIGVRGKQDLSRFLKSGKLKPHIASSYSAPDTLNALDGGKPQSPATKPIAYTTINNETRLWVPAGGSYVTVDPVEWNLLQRIIGKEGTWHYESRSMGERFLVHVSEKSERDAFILAKQASYVPQGVRDIDDKAMKGAAPPAGKVQYSAAQDQTPAPTLADVQEIFKGQEVWEGPDGTIFIKTRSGAALSVIGVDNISVSEINFRMGYSRKIGSGERVVGGYGRNEEGWMGVIKLIKDAAGKVTLAHESAHFMEDFGIINAEDASILRGHIKDLVRSGKRKTANEDDIGGAEDRANFLADALTQAKPPGGLVGLIVARVRKFLDRLMEAFGIRTAGAVTRDVKSGRIFEREGQGSSFADEAYSLAPATIKAYDEALSVHAYISPRVKPSLSAQEKTIRDNAYGVKGMDPVVLDGVAKEMAALIPKEAGKSAILVPIPGHTGDTAANVALAERIAAITGSRVADVLKRQAGQSQRDARVAGRRTMKPVEFGMVSTETLDGDNVFFVDNVISSGATIRAARDAVGGGKGLVYAKSNPKGEKYTIGTMDLELPKWLGDKVKQALKKDAVASILIDAGPIQSGPLDGGCRVLARALKRIEPSGKIITIEGQLKDGTWQAEHYGFELDGGMIDGDGYAASREAWAKRFAKNESLDSPYRITEGEVQSEDIPQDAPTEKKLAAALEKELAPDEAYREPRAEQGIAVYEHLPVFAITEKGLTRKPRRALNNNQEVSNGQEVSGTTLVRADNALAAGQGTDDKRKIPAPGGRVLPYVPERGTLPTVKSEPIGTWKSSRRKITSLEDAAVIARDNLFRDAQEVFVTIVTDKSGKILAVNQHATGAPNQSQVYAYFAAGQILNIEGASKVWTVHNHPSGQAKLSEADLSVSSNIGDLIADAGIESMPIIAITPSRYSDNMWSSEPLPPKEPAIYKLPVLGRKFDQSPEGLESIGSQNEFEEFGRLYMKEGGMVLVSAQRQPVALIAIDDYSKLRPLHTEILREAEKRNAVDFMIYSPEKTLTKADIDNLLSFAKNTQLEFTTVRDRAGDHYEKIKELWGAVRNSKERKVFYSVQKDAIDNTSIFPEANERLNLPADVIELAEASGVNPKDIKIIKLEDRTEYFSRYGVPNSINEGYGYFGGRSGSLFIDDDTGKPVAYLPAAKTGAEGKLQYSVQRDTIDSSSIFPDVNERIKMAKGVKYASLKDRAKDALVTGWEHFTRHFQHLEPETNGAVIDVFRKFQDVPAWAKDETVRQLSGFIGRLSPQGRDVFMMNILLPDMIRDIEDGTLVVEDEVGLPFGYKNRDQVQQDYDHFRAIAEGSTAIMEALDRRNTFMASLTDQLIQHKLLKKEVANDPTAYFHHQVLAYMNYKENPNWGMSSQDVRTHRKGWQVGRKGSQLDYNTEYVESEFEIISQALTQIETVKSLKEIERLADIKPELEAEAKDQNMATFRRKAFTNPLDDPLLPYRVKIAMGFQKLAKLFTTENDMGSLPMEFDDVIEHIVDQEEQRRAAKEDEIEFDPVPHPRMFALLNYLINHEGPGSMPAAMIFKAIAARNAFIKQVVGKDWVTYRDLIPEGYVAHKPETGSTFYFTNSIADQALAQVLAGHKNLPDAVRQVMARGRDEEWVVKEGISKTLNEFRPAMSDSLPAKMSKSMLTAWKQWILMNPFRVIKYNINNMSGDLDIALAYDPKIITDYFTQAFKDLWAASRGNASETLMDELSGLTKRGVVGSGMTAMDIPELGDVKSVKGLVDFFDGKSKNALSRWWTMSKKLSTLRENILRLAANRYFLDRLAKGDIVYGASRKEEVDAIENRDDKAAKLARELIGDYGNISHAGQYIRERMIPFYSWLEINAPRYVRLFRNLKDEGGGGIGAMGGVLAWKTTKLAVKASALMGLVMLWNAAFFPDEEDELQEAGREQLHMILGRRADGSIITLRFQGALSDALSWFGMGNPVEQAKKVVSGTKGAGDLAKEVVKAAPLKLFQGFRPEPKLLYETLSGQSFFPDPMHPRPIRDTTEHILRTFSLDRIYNQASGKPKQGGTWATQMYRDIQSLALTEADPGEQAYYTSRKYIFDWLDKQGKEKPAAMPTNRSNSLYYYKQALKFGDFDAAEKYLKKYQDMGGKLHDVMGSIRRVHPLASLRLADRYKFKVSLSPEQQETLSVATAWYKKHYVDTYQEQRKRGM